jgi:hypothetical protein
MAYGPQISLEWQRLGAFPATALRRARLQAHAALQPLVQVTRGYVPSRGDDSHNSFSWSPRLNALLSGEIAAGTLPFRLGLRLSTLTLLAVGRDSIELGSSSLHGKTLSQERTWLSFRLAEAGLDWVVLEKPVHYRIAANEFLEGLPFEVTEELSELARYFGNAALVLNGIAEALPGASPVRCWPHHFDIATLQPLGNEQGSLRVGLSPGDDSYDQPYFYAAPSAVNSSMALPVMKSGGQWHTENWTGAVLTGEDIVRQGDAGEQAAFVTTWLNEAIEAARAVIAK